MAKLDKKREKNIITHVIEKLKNSYKEEYKIGKFIDLINGYDTDADWTYAIISMILSRKLTISTFYIIDKLEVLREGLDNCTWYLNNLDKNIYENLKNKCKYGKNKKRDDKNKND